MNTHDATEIAYKNGYAKAIKDFKHKLNMITTTQKFDVEEINKILSTLESSN